MGKVLLVKLGSHKRKNCRTTVLRRSHDNHTTFLFLLRTLVLRQVCHMSTTIRQKNCCTTSIVEIEKILSPRHVLRHLAIIARLFWYENMFYDSLTTSLQCNDCIAMFTFLVFYFGALIKLLFVLI